MKVRTTVGIVALLISALLLAACSSGSPAPTAAPSQAAQETTAPQTAAPTDGTAVAPTDSPTPAPTAAESAAAPKVGTFVAADDKAYYCVKDNSIVRLDKSTMAETTVREISELFHIYSIFLDANGSLYYLCVENETDDRSNTLYRLNSEAGDVQDFILAENVALVLRVTGSDIYYLDDTGQICSYGIAAGQVKETGFAGFELSPPAELSGELPFCLLQKCIDDVYVTYQYNFNENKLDEYLSVDAISLATLDGRHMLYYTFNEENTVAKASLYDAGAAKMIADNIDMSQFVNSGIKSALVKDGKLYLVTEELQKYTISRLDLASLQMEAVQTIPNENLYGNLRTALFDGRYMLLYFEAVSKGTAEEPKEITPKLGVYDLDSNSLSYVGEFTAFDFNNAHMAAIDVLDDYLFLSEDKSIYAPNTGEYQYSGYIDLSKIQ